MELVARGFTLYENDVEFWYLNTYLLHIITHLVLSYKWNGNVQEETSGINALSFQCWK